MKKSATFTGIQIVALLLTTVLATAAVPQMINFQGRLTDDMGTPFDGTVPMTFTIYDAESGGNVKWTETHPAVIVTEGLFHVILGAGTPAVPITDDIFNQPDRWLGITVDTDSELEPRTRLVSVGYSHRVNTVDGATGGTISGDVAIQSNLNVSGRIYAEYDDFSLLVDGAIDGYSVVSEDHSAIGVMGRAQNTGATGYAYGGYFTALENYDAEQGRRCGVEGIANGGCNSQIASWAHGVRGIAYGGDCNGYGVYGQAVSDNAMAAGGAFRANGVSGPNYGVSALAWSGESYDGYGVSGTASSSNDQDVYGGYFSGSRLEGGTGTTYGIYAYADNYAGYFSGDVTVTGTLSKGAGSFKIDHPLDPENKYLVHSFVESPDMMNVYNGNAILDADGMAIVELPDYFEALNMEFRYQLTPIGAPGPNLYIAEEIMSNRFTIAGGEPGMKVSWQVTGIRKDAYAEARRIKVEIDKPESERGKYLHPEVFNLGEEYGVDYIRNSNNFDHLPEGEE